MADKSNYSLACLERDIGRFEILDASLLLRQLLCLDRDEAGLLNRYAEEWSLGVDVDVALPAAVGTAEKFHHYVCRFGVLLGSKAWINKSFFECGDNLIWESRSFPWNSGRNIIDEAHGFRTVSLEQYLGEPVFIAHEEIRSRDDVINYVANKRGGAHLDYKISERDQSRFGIFDVFRTKVEFFARLDDRLAVGTNIMGEDSFELFILFILQHLTFSQSVWRIYCHSAKMWDVYGYPPLENPRPRLVFDSSDENQDQPQPA